MRPLAPLLPLALLAACGGSNGAGGYDGPELDGVVIFTVDTLRADQLGAYGGDYPTPALDRLAGESLVFGRAYSQATITLPSVTSMLTGILPQRHGVLLQTGLIADGIFTLPQVLSGRDVETGSFVANLCKHQGSERTAWHDGWDVRYCGLEMDPAYEQWAWDEDVVTQGMEWIEERDDNFLAWIHLMDPHAEHRPPPDRWDYENDPPMEAQDQYIAFNQWEIDRTFPEGADKQRLWDLYRAEVEGVDRQVGRFLDFLDGLPNGDRIAVIFSADHGEELYETWSRYDHGLALTEGVLWVPMMVRAPGVEPGWSDEIVELLQVTPTVLDLMGVPALHALDGESLLADEPSRGFAFSSAGNVSVCVRDENHRYYLRLNREPYTREGEGSWRADAPWFRDRQGLVAYGADVESQTDVEWLEHASTDGRITSLRFLQQLGDLAKGLGDPPEIRNIDDPDVLAQLADLGYMESEIDGPSGKTAPNWQHAIEDARRELAE